MDPDAHQLNKDTLMSLKRLTDKEKDCLRRRLNNQTAKEMAIDLGVSPHAIEKRLKMARTKLGVSSSRQASRLLAASEEYQTTVPQLSDVGGTLAPRDTLRRQSIALGVILMSVSVVTIISLIMTAVGPASEPVVFPKPGEILITGPSTFNELDEDKSGFLEGDEVPSLVLFGGKLDL